MSKAQLPKISVLASFIFLLVALTSARAQPISATWIGGNSGNFSNPLNWLCFGLNVPAHNCVPSNASTLQFLGSATVNVDLNVIANSISSNSGVPSFILNGTSLTTSNGLDTASLRLSNGASTNSPTLDTTNLTMQNSTITRSGFVYVAPFSSATASAAISGSQLGRLELTGSLNESNNSTVGTTSAPANVNLISPSSITNSTFTGGGAAIQSTLDVGNSHLNLSALVIENTTAPTGPSSLNG